MMTALKLCGNPLIANAKASVAISPLATRPRCRSLVVYAAKASTAKAPAAKESPPTIRQADFVQKLATELNVPEHDAKEALKKVLDLITEEVCSGNKVAFVGWVLCLLRPALFLSCCNAPPTGSHYIATALRYIEAMCVKTRLDAGGLFWHADLARSSPGKGLPGRDATLRVVSRWSCLPPRPLPSRPAR